MVFRLLSCVELLYRFQLHSLEDKLYQREIIRSSTAETTVEDSAEAVSVV